MISSRPALMAEILLRPYARIVFARDLVTGALLLAAIGTAPRLALATLVAVALAQSVVWFAGLGMTALRDGTLACGAVLSTLGLGYALGSIPWALLIPVVVISVLATAALQALFVRAALPALAMPFILTTWIALLASRVLPADVLFGTEPANAINATWSWLPAWTTAPSWLDAPALLLYRHGALAGALLLVAIAWYSRIALLLSAVGGAVTMLMHLTLRTNLPWSEVDTLAAFNAMITAMALGGIWFVPQLSSVALAIVSAMVVTLVTYAVATPLATWSLPTLALPFVLTTWLMLLAMRMRETDRSPASAMLADTPEEALMQHLMRVRRFGEFAWLPFRLPFRGAWTVTQGHNGAHTHRGPWRYAFDFEMRGVDGNTFEGSGRELSDYRCYGMPVLAGGGGIVEQVIDGVPDNPVNGVNARENWGNVVILAHSATLYSVYAHLRPGSVNVRVGDRVMVGSEIAKCGNSGRSLVPHLHFQVQRNAVLGSETLAVDFGDVVRRDEQGMRISSRVIPNEGDVIRPVLRDESLIRALTFAPGSAWIVRDEEAGTEEMAGVEVDLWSRHVLRTQDAALYLEPYDEGLVVIAFEGNHRSALRYLFLALARLPFDQETTFRWSDRVPQRLLSTWPWSLLDLIAIVAPGKTVIEMAYTAKRSERALIVDGAAGTLKTRATISLDGNPHRFSMINAAGAEQSSVTLRRAVPTEMTERAA